MGIYILILTLYAGPLAQTDSVALTTAEFSSAQSCEAAGHAATKLGTAVKVAKFVCVAK